MLDDNAGLCSSSVDCQQLRDAPSLDHGILARWLMGQMLGLSRLEGLVDFPISIVDQCTDTLLPSFLSQVIFTEASLFALSTSYSQLRNKTLNCQEFLIV